MSCVAKELAVRITDMILCFHPLASKHLEQRGQMSDYERVLGLEEKRSILARGRKKAACFVENAREEERPDVDYRAHAADQAALPMQLLVVRPHVAQESAQAGEPGQGVPGAVAHGQKEEGRGGLTYRATATEKEGS